MFRHKGNNRTITHNLQIATVLSFVAGIVNVVGFLSIQKLTTNVTGHFAYFIYDIFKFEFWKGLIYLIYILSFLFGSFISSVLIELVDNHKKLNIFVLPTLLESLILIVVATLSLFYFSPNLIAFLLLFAMGVQNSFVTKISNTVVRTTHLTGLFTDLGIELSQLLFPKKHPDKVKIKSTIKLRIYIIGFFFLGGIFGGFMYSKIGLNTLFFGSIILIFGLMMDNLKYKYIVSKRKYKTKKTQLSKKLDLVFNKED